jgi:hypothetical protein
MGTSSSSSGIESSIRGREQLSNTAMLAQAALSELRDNRDPLDFLGRWVDVLRSLDGPESEGDVAALGWYVILRVPRTYRTGVFEYMQQQLNKTGERVIVTIADELREEGREQGREEGREQGRAQGREEGRAEMQDVARQALVDAILDALQTRQVPLDTQQRAALETCTSLDTLKAWLHRALRAEDAAHVFED